MGDQKLKKVLKSKFHKKKYTRKEININEVC